MSYSAAPLWLVGFRPFFALACLAGLSLPTAWVLILAGVLPPPAAPYGPVQWHAHEMFYGFGWAVLGGFLLTASKNWVNVRGYHGPTLMLLAGAWILERLALALGGTWPPVLFFVASNVFLGALVVLLAATLIRHRATDSYRDNGFFLLILPLFLLAKNLLLDPDHFASGWSLTLALFRVAFLIMLERTLTPFMQGAFQVRLLRWPPLDRAIKGLAALLLLDRILPPGVSGLLALALALLLSGRLLLWKPWVALGRLEIGVMYGGYLALVVQLVLQALAAFGHPVGIGSVAVHVFTLGAMGLVIPAMIVRIAKGHTGRKVVFDGGDRAVLWIMVGAFAARVVLPQLAPAAYLPALHLAATCWLVAFATLAWRYIPFLLAPRVDGREH